MVTRKTTKDRKPGLIKTVKKHRQRTKRLDCCGNPIKLKECERGRKGAAGLLAWTAPEDMPDRIAQQVLAGKMCGAERKGKTGVDKYCRSRAVIQRSNGYPPPFKCKHHGGASTGPRAGTQNNLKHGLYSNAILPGEEEIYAEIATGTVDEEIRITKLRLRRAIYVESRMSIKHGEGEDCADELICESIEHSDGWNSLGPIGNKKIVKKLPDIKRTIHDIITQLVKLENQKLVLEVGGQGELSPEERAAKARAFIMEARKTVPSNG